MSGLFGKLCGSSSHDASKAAHKDALASGAAPLAAGSGWSCTKGCTTQRDCTHGSTMMSGWSCDKGCKTQQSCSHFVGARGSTTVDSNVAVAPTINLPTEYLPPIHKTEVMPTEVHREVQTTVHNVVQPMRKDIIQPIETTIEKPVVREIQPVHQTIIQPKVETVLHEAPAARVEAIHQTKTLGTVNQKLEKPPVELPTKVGAPIVAPPVVEKTQFVGTDSHLRSGQTGLAQSGMTQSNLNTNTTGHTGLVGKAMDAVGLGGHKANQQLKGTTTGTTTGTTQRI